MNAAGRGWKPLAGDRPRQTPGGPISPQTTQPPGRDAGVTCRSCAAGDGEVEARPRALELRLGVRDTNRARFAILTSLSKT